MNKKPVGFEFSSNMHMYYAFDNYIYSFSSVTTYVFLVWQTYFFHYLCQKFLKLYTHVHVYKILMPMKCQICKPYFFTDIFDLLTIPHLAVIFLFTATIHYCNVALHNYITVFHCYVSIT